MSFRGFGRNSGPQEPKTQNPFANLPQKRSPTPPLARSPRNFETFNSPPLVYETRQFETGPSQLSAGVQSQSPTWGNGQNFFYKDYDAQVYEGPSAFLPFNAPSSSFTTGVPNKASQIRDARSIRSPPFLSSGGEILRNTRGIRVSRADLLPKRQSQLAPDNNQSSSLSFQRSSYADEAHLSSLPSPMRGDQPKTSSNFTTSLTNPVISPLPTHVVSDPGRKSPVDYADLNMSKRSRSPTFPSNSGGSGEDSFVALQNSQRPSTSPPKVSSSNHYVPPGSQSHRQPPTSGYPNKAEIAADKTASFPAAKKNKLLPLSTRDQVLQDTSNSPEDEANREELVKMKRLMRFKDELSRPMGSDQSFENQKVHGKSLHPVTIEKKRLNGGDADDVIGDSSNGNPSEYENLDSSGVIVGLCLDMCPESERGERERKGDLDQFERLDGDRNQTSISLAVKKYNRTAEREAELIRPMPVLEKTMDYLLNLLNQPYDDRFLGLYNFLWDRMRAIRMDLRMQHIFGLGAVKMLEQMIRLHIVAMYELCEFPKGEGFSEGFDAHLNIEQMNKTSVELFQLYDDHRKKGINVVTEKEFRGYYALLKLDKHPGHKVEPAELSLDLAKMRPDIRHTPEVIFARDVARACRTFNFIAFFNLARKASYLQACLMHAHFAKLRTQALAALHCGLQNNQGIPVAVIAEWLGMEEEEIEDLLEYHGFSLKEFEVPYMVKEGTLLNVDSDYPVKCSKLVNKKKSGAIVEDVTYPCLAKLSSPRETKMLDLGGGIKQKPAHIQAVQVNSISVPANEVEMLDYVSSPKNDMQVIPALGTSDIQRVQLVDHPSPASPLVRESSKSDDSPSSLRNRGGSEGKSKYDSRFRSSFGRDIHVESKETPLHTRPVGEANIMLPPSDNVLEDSLPEHRMMEELVEEHNDLDEEAIVNEGTTTLYDQEVAEAKLKLILRIWRRLSLKKRKLRAQKQLAANTALTSLLLGPPIWSREVLSGSSGDFDIDRVMRERCEIRDKSLSSLNVSELVAAKLSAKNPDAKCLCWKVILLTEDSIYGENLRKRNEISHFAAGSWLQSKLFPAGCNDDNTVDLPVSSPGMSIWKKWLPSQSGDEGICCFTIIKDVKLGNLKDEVTGASAILFLASEYIPWESQRNWLHNFLMALPFASSLPLLVLTGLCEDDLSSSSIIEELKLRDIDKSHISNFSVAFLRNQQMNQFNGFYSDEQLRGGLQWLASESPSQPLLRQIKTRDLVHYHLNSLLEVLDDMDDHELGPNHCISAFNEALDQASRKVVSAVQANGTSWPCPEICLLEESCDEYRAISWFLPSIGWSSAARIEPLIRALSDIKLPPFEDDIRLIRRVSDMGNNIERQRSQLESCLIRYFTESSQMMPLSLAAKEAGIALQKFAQLELRNSVYCIKPKWVLIFQRVFHWRLMELSDAAFSAAYILRQDYVPMSTSGAHHRVERSAPLPYLAHPSLDEMVAVSCDPPTPEKFHVDYGALQPCSEVYHSDDRAKMETGATECSTGDDGRCVEQSSMVVAKHDNAKNEASNVNKLCLAPNTATAADRLSELLDKCNIVQSMIQEKLSIYF